MPVFLLFSWCSHFISLSSSHPQSTILCVILLALFFTATFVLQQTSTFVYTGLPLLSYLLPCDSCQKEWDVRLEVTRKLVLTLSLVAFSVCCVLNASFTSSTDLNFLSITFCKSPSCDKSCNTFKNLKFRFLNIQFLYVHHCYFPCFAMNVTFIRTKLDLVVSSILCLLCTFSGPAIK